MRSLQRSRRAEPDWHTPLVFAILASGSTLSWRRRRARPRRHSNSNSNLRGSTVRIPAFCLMLFVSLSARAGTACDALLGDYAPAAGKSATMRVEKVGSDIVLRAREAGRWSVDTAPVHVAELDMDGPEKPPADACVLEVPGGQIIRMPIGTPYQVTSITGNGFTTKRSTTGVLLLMTQGFQVDGIELYRVARSGASPSAP
ncbi:hypothetical protein [Burkholderia cenocepacia]|uniref:hypothetical protein n=1 Tax=Burkholderia cenocepacia TaxID=95486 RepID=UPI00215AC0E6|nr:hypothetical protein [Burkholderia cenocepacia]